jgi:hypothetical protein
VSDRLTLATATGLPLLFLAFHFGTGLIFVCAMIATGITAVGIATYEGKPGNIGGAIIVYFVITAYTAVKPLPGVSRRVDIALMLLAFAFAAGGYANAFTALGRPGNQIDGVPAGMMLFMATIILLAAIGDARLIRAGGIHGTRRLARHLWRMLFGLFIASGSFFIGQMQFIPEPIRIVPLIVVLGVSPLVLLLYWMWRVRVRQNLRGMMTAKPI